MGRLSLNALQVLMKENAESDRNKFKASAGVMMKRIRLSVLLDSHGCRFLLPVTSHMGTALPALIGSGAGKPAVPLERISGARSDRATLLRKS